MSYIWKKWKKFFYINPKGILDSDSAWKQQNERMKDNDVYKMVNFSGGGLLIEEFDKVGKNASDEDRKRHIQEYFEREVLPVYLNEECQEITVDKYREWHKQQNVLAKHLMNQKLNDGTADNLAFDHEEHVDGMDNLSVCSLDSVVKPFRNHSVKWKLEKRGAVGETPLHLLILNNSEKHTKIASAILEQHPELALDLYEGFEYYGESCLHLAIIQGNTEAVKLLLKTKQLDVHASARGKFFKPVDIKRGDVKLRKHRFEGYAYYGEYPLSFAASVGHYEIYDMLIEHGCDPNMKDTHGNNVLHLTVIHDQPDMYYHAVKNAKVKADSESLNNDNLTPLALAAKLGRKDMFIKILEISSRDFWSYNTVTCSVYPLKSLDTIGPEGKTDWNSALMMIIQGKKDTHLDLVSHEVVQQLLQEKWSKFARSKFYRLLFWYVLHVLILSTAVYLRPDAAADLQYGSQATDIVRYVFEALLLLLCCGVMFFTAREVFLENLHGFWLNVRSIPSRFVYLLACVLTIACIPFRFTGLYTIEDWILVFAVPGTWLYFLFFLRSKSFTGPLIVMIYKIVATDIFRFAIIFGVIWLTFGFALSYQFQGQNVFAFLTPLGTLMTLFQMSFGDFSYDDVLLGKHPVLSVLLFILFMILVHILLLSMLIAMMTRTFEKITAKSEKVWKQQWAAMVIVMERSHQIAEKRKFQASYGMNLKAERVSSEGEAPVRQRRGGEVDFDNLGLMVIRHSSTSESQRRRNIQKRWKSTQKKTVQGGSHDTPKNPSKFKIHSAQGMSNFVMYQSTDDENNVDDESDNDSGTQAHNLVTTVSSALRNAMRKPSNVQTFGNEDV